MTTETVLVSTDWDPESPITTTLAGAWSQNWIAGFEGNSTTKIQTDAYDDDSITFGKLAQATVGTAYTLNENTSTVIGSTTTTWETMLYARILAGGSVTASVQYARYPDGSGNSGRVRVLLDGAVYATAPFVGSTSFTTYTVDVTGIPVNGLLQIQLYGTQTTARNAAFKSDTDAIWTPDTRVAEAN